MFIFENHDYMNVCTKVSCSVTNLVFMKIVLLHWLCYKWKRIKDPTQYLRNPTRQVPNGIK